jgi:uncharacterized protein YbaP (TraB family)
MLMRLLIAIAFLAAGPAFAACRDDGLMAGLTPGEAARLEAADAERHGRGLVWRATRDGREIVLVGTLHLDDPRLGAVMDRVRPHLANARRVLLEARGEELARVEALALEEPGRLFLLDGPTLVDMLAPEEWAAVSGAAEALGIPGFVAAQFRPFYLLLALSLPPCAAEGLVAGRPGLDLMIEAEAEAMGLPVGALEPYDTVIEVFTALGEDDALALLVANARAPDLAESALAVLLDLYFEGRTAAAIALNDVVVERTPGLDEARREAMTDWFERVLLAERNEAWIPSIEAAAEEESPVLVAVGAAHLPGEAGVLSLLEEAGWSVGAIDP